MFLYLCLVKPYKINIMKSYTTIKSLVLSMVIILGMSSFSNDNQTSTNESAKESGAIADVLDSICAEGYNLFLAEYVNWVATDSILAHYSIDQIGRNIVWQPTADSWSVVFTDKEVNNCIFEFRYDKNSKRQTISYEKRPISENEIALIEKKGLMLNNAFQQYGDSLRYNPDYGNPNFDLIRIDAKTTRMYMLQGLNRAGIIPFGNDFSFDFDNDCNITAFRRYHRSFLPQPNDAESITHSHLRNNPYITPTDICNFLLYRGTVKELSVYSTFLKGYIVYNHENNTATFFTSEEMSKRRK